MIGADGTFAIIPRFARHTITRKTKHHAQVFKIIGLKQIECQIKKQNRIRSAGYLCLIALLQNKDEKAYDWLFGELKTTIGQHKIKTFICDFEVIS